MAATIILGIVIVALGLGTVVYTFWHEGSPIHPQKRNRDSADRVTRTG